ncbi:helix-turn-helix domain-containing protein [Myxococcus sp. Y35]|uniref:helix-turn-helix domain-containing protein n=1 Tax=Pseudomyxococcus flavus TaxID=3115648 RepID=UPI003CEBF32A
MEWMSPADARLYIRLEGDPLYAPETSVPRGTLAECSVLAALSNHVAHVEVYRDDISGVAFEHVLPDGAVRLMFDLGSRHGQAWAAGPSTKPTRLRLEGAIANLTVTLHPGAAFELLGVPARALRDQCIPLESLWPRDIASVSEKLATACDDHARSVLVQSLLSARLARAKTSERTRAVHALRLLRTGRRTVREAAAALGLGERRLQQLFETEVGLTPRAYRRLARVHACLRALRRSPSPRWAELALDHGFYDQAHLANEFRGLLGLSPTAFVESVSGSSKTAR